jgi:hypothetical protein
MSEVYIKFSPCLAKKDTIIKKLSDTAISIDGEEIGPFDLDGVSWPNVSTETAGAVNEAHRADGDLYLTVTRYYTSTVISVTKTANGTYTEINGCSGSWDDGQYHKIEVEV